MDMTKGKYIMFAECPKCGTTLIRPLECTHATCKCSNPYPIVELHPGIILPDRLHNKAKKIADREKIPLDTFVNMLLELALEHINDTWERR